VAEVKRAALLLLATACAGARPIPSAARCGSIAADPEALRRHVEALSTGFFPRDFEHSQNLDRAAAYIADALRAVGVRSREQQYQVEGRTFRNVIAEIGPITSQRIVIGAHYDAAGEQPGADDNASGVAGIVELARLLRAAPPPMRVELAAWTLEEPPNFRTARMGSAVHAARLARTHAKVRLMISVEMIGTFSDQPGSQQYPAPLSLFYPSTGNFVAVVGKWDQGDVLGEVADALRAGSSLPVVTLSAPDFVPGVDFSDHLNFWAHRYPAVMVGDTAFYRNPRYHTADDRPEHLDYRRMAEVVKGLHCVVQAAARH
jgi:Peptidase family M28